MREPDFSVVVPSRNEGRTMRACLESLAGQDYPGGRYEVIVVDGGSTDGTLETAREFGVHLLTDAGRGVSAARNVGIVAARAPLVAFTDADCVPDMDWLARIRDVYRERPRIGGVGGALRMTRHTFLGRLEDVAAQARYRGVITSNAAYRRRVLLEVGGFDETLLCGEDWDLAWRVRDAGYEVIHDRRPVVTHDPPELRANALRFLGKEMWYGRHDVPAHLRAVLRALREPASCSGSRAALDAVGDSAVNVFCLAALVGGAAAASPALVGLGMGAAAIRASREVLAARKVEPLRPTHASRAVALQTARVFARGAGTVTGYVDLAAGAARSALARPGRDADASTTSLPSAKAAPSPPTAP